MRLRCGRLKPTNQNLSTLLAVQNLSHPTIFLQSQPLHSVQETREFLCACIFAVARLALPPKNQTPIRQVFSQSRPLHLPTATRSIKVGVYIASVYCCGRCRKPNLLKLHRSPRPLQSTIFPAVLTSASTCPGISRTPYRGSVTIISGVSQTKISKEILQIILTTLLPLNQHIKLDNSSRSPNFCSLSVFTAQVMVWSHSITLRGSLRYPRALES